MTPPHHAMNLLLVEDETQVADFIQRGLKAEGWSVAVAPDGETAFDLLAHDDYSVMILDVMLGGMSGFDVCRRMRENGDLTPILILTALDGADDRVAGLRIGADDYLVKPFNFSELLARIEALHRRATDFKATPENVHQLKSGALSFDTRSLEVTYEGHRLELTAKERELLRLFMSNPGRVYSRDWIINTIWGGSVDPLTNVVDVYIGRLRKKLGSAGGAIQTVRGAGYRFTPTE